MKYWPFSIQTWPRSSVLAVVYGNNIAWQIFRNSLKGLSTETKLDALLEWRSSKGIEAGYTHEEVIIQVDNYVLALMRGGFITSESREVIK